MHASAEATDQYADHYSKFRGMSFHRALPDLQAAISHLGGMHSIVPEFGPRSRAVAEFEDGLRGACLRLHES